ncbi:hypothetical protein [Arcobacter sp. FWKO B]|uniref:hypothetical protein n=1 Tax=Arcobacter sp. FWKO B TaxID=2593672 RepID=UPI0018A691C7|nr:hypothetical protein [Arcobacter sp. FWKO B]QOG13045.1 hypothetical protein FWKOB_10245 [Arcobacter sp. FWKO B]
MKKIVLTSLIASNLLLADLTTTVTKQDQQSESTKEQLQKSINKALTDTESKSRGDENSINKSLSKSLTETRSVTQNATQSKTGTWSVTINPVPYVLMQLRQNGWDKRAFFITNQELGTSYYLDDNEDDGIIDLNKKSYVEAKASTRGKMSKEQLKKIEEVVNILHYTGTVAEHAINNMNKYHNPDTTNIEDLALKAVIEATKKVKHRYINLYKCNYGGSNDVYVCNDSEYTLSLSQVGASVGIPSLLKNGVAYYSADKIGFSTPTLTLAFANTTSEAMSKLLQDSESSAVAQAVREYTSTLRSQGQTKTASQIESAFVEKALTKNVNKDIAAVKQAIDSASPTSVLKIFQ